MKNIHVLPTDKPSRICKDGLGKFHLMQSMVSKFPFFKNQHIYITSDEEIKEGDWALDLCEDLGLKYEAFKVDKATLKYANQECQKIILTDDEDLIKDGVQVIDDEFLEWFVKNPSCEEVGVIPLRKSSGYYDKKDNWHWDFLAYKIIIPKEEPKQETQGYICPQTKKQCDDECCVSAKDCHLEASIGVLSEPKQETIEEVAEKFAKKFGSEIDSTRYYAFINGAKWQQERMYSEEEVEDLIYKVCGTVARLQGITLNGNHIDSAYKQYKKK